VGFAANPLLPLPQSSLASGKACTLHTTIISLRALRDPSMMIHSSRSDQKENGGKHRPGGASFTRTKEHVSINEWRQLGIVKGSTSVQPESKIRGLKLADASGEIQFFLLVFLLAQTTSWSHFPYNHTRLKPQYHIHHASLYPNLISKLPSPQLARKSSAGNGLQLWRSRQPKLNAGRRGRIRNPNYHAFPQPTRGTCKYCSSSLEISSQIAKTART